MCLFLHLYTFGVVLNFIAQFLEALIPSLNIAERQNFPTYCFRVIVLLETEVLNIIGQSSNVLSQAYNWDCEGSNFGHSSVRSVHVVYVGDRRRDYQSHGRKKGGTETWP